RLSRTTSVLVLLVSFFLLLMAGGLLLIPLLRLQVENLALSLPDYIGTLEAWARPYMEKLSLVDPEKVQSQLKEAAQKLGALPLELVGSASRMLWNSLSSLMTLLFMLLSFLIIPVAMFYLLRDFDRITGKLLGLAPPQYRPGVVAVFRDIDRVLAGFVRGQLMVATLMAALYSAGLFLCGTPMSLFIGMLAGYANLVPFLGLVFGFTPAAVLTYLQFPEWGPFLGVVGVFAVVQALEGLWITPRVMGNKIGLHPVVIMLAVLVGGELFGFMGVLLGVPAAAVLNVLGHRTLTLYKDSSLFK
ncbi:MAG: AI-2E family transporter, partial [Nitrospinaceae bacterium]